MNPRLASFLVASGLIALAPAAVCATRRPPPAAADRSAIADYVHARAADDLGELGAAAQGYAAALAANPGNTTLGLRTFRQAIAAGDMALAVQTARTLDAGQSLPPDGALVLLADAVSRKDWKGASALADRMDREKLFAFLSPIVRGWIALGTGKGDPLAPLAAIPAGSLSSSYAAEHRALLMLALWQTQAGASAIAALPMPDGGRAARLRIAAAAALDRRHKRDAALLILIGDSAPIRGARATLTARHRLTGAIDTPAGGIAELFVRVAADINKDQAAPLALELGRLAAQLAPQDSEAWLVTASLLAGGGASQAALDALGHIAPDDPFAGTARDARMTILSQTGRRDEALAEAEKATRANDAGFADWARYGDLLSAAKRPVDAARAYARALDLAGGDKATPQLAWPLLLQQGNALMQAGDWPAARAAAERALAAAPDQPDVLNFLGYSQLERGENVAAAGAMVAKASALAPNDPAITDSLGWSWYLRGDLGKAIPLLERAAKGAPAESDINEHLGDAYWKAGRGLDARYAWRAALVTADGDQATRLKSKLDYGATGKP